MELLDVPAPPGSGPAHRPELWQLHLAVHETGDETARAALVDEYRPNAIALARRLHRDREPLEDLVQIAVEMLHHDLGRSPTPGEVADLLGITAAEVREAMQATAARSVRSLDGPVDDQSLDPGAVELGYGRLEEHDALRRAIDDLEPQQQRVLALYYDEGLTQSAIGELLGCSQMHVSRLLSRAVGQLRVALVGDAEPAERAG